MRYDSGVGHPNAERVLPLFHVSGIHAGHRDMNTELARPRHRFGHLSDD
jgi:hypothetical protein